MTDTSDRYLDHLKAARDAPAVLKFRLAKLRSNDHTVVIFAIEGNNDKAIYTRWIKRVVPEMKFELLPCKGKSKVLSLRRSVQRDRASLANGVYFFIDRDFDDLQDQDPGDDIFMTDRYSVESYIVSESVLEDILADELHCEGEPHVRKRVLDLFRNVYGQFLNATRKLNRRLYIARRTRTPVVGGLPTKLADIAVVTLTSVSATCPDAETLIEWAKGIDDNTVSELDKEFKQLDPETRYRGKFALMFFIYWLKLVAEERGCPRSGLLFEHLEAKKANAEQLPPGLLASRSPLPNGFAHFVGRIGLQQQAIAP